jgi:cytochrome c-type biogenesis protein CcmF
MAFSFAVAALIEGRVDAAWGRWVRPWTLAAWVFLTIGIGLGSWWAYYELGWGGFWFWDPVENASFMPWLIAAALLHSAIVVEKREALKSWTILLAILAFGFSLIGTFIVRSGVLTSVHAFANDPERGVFILMILGVFMGGALLLFALRAGAMEAKGVFSTVSRESGLVLNNLLLAVSTFVVFIGTIWPLIAEMFFDRTLVGRPALLRRGLHALRLRRRRGPAHRGDAAVETRGARAALARAGPRDGAGAGLRAPGLGDVHRQVGAGAHRRWRCRSGWWRAPRSICGRAPGAGRLGHRLGRLTRLPRADWGKTIAHAGSASPCSGS